MLREKRDLQSDETDVLWFSRAVSTWPGKTKYPDGSPNYNEDLYGTSVFHGVLNFCELRKNLNGPSEDCAND